MSEEVLTIGLISGITCPDGRQFQNWYVMIKMEILLMF
jgi:hypothetical protein